MPAGAFLLLSGFAVGGLLRAGTMVASGVMLVVIVTIVFAIARHWTLFSSLEIIINRTIRFPRCRQLLEHKLKYLTMLEAYIFAFYSHGPFNFFIVVLCQIGFHLLGVAEAYVALRFTDLKVTLLMSFIFEAVNRAVNIVFNFVPARAGVDEASSALLSKALGLGAEAGVTLAIIRKARILFWSALGLFFFAYENSLSKQKHCRSC
jgi:hypothetical protein